MKCVKCEQEIPVDQSHYELNRYKPDNIENFLGFVLCETCKQALEKWCNLREASPESFVAKTGDIILRWHEDNQIWEVIFVGSDLNLHSKFSDGLDKAMCDIIELIKMMS